MLQPLPTILVHDGKSSRLENFCLKKLSGSLKKLFSNYQKIAWEPIGQLIAWRFGAKITCLADLKNNPIVLLSGTLGRYGDNVFHSVSNVKSKFVQFVTTTFVKHLISWVLGQNVMEGMKMRSCFCLSVYFDHFHANGIICHCHLFFLLQQNDLDRLRSHKMINRLKLTMTSTMNIFQDWIERRQMVLGTG